MRRRRLEEWLDCRISSTESEIIRGLRNNSLIIKPKNQLKKKGHNMTKQEFVDRTAMQLFSTMLKNYGVDMAAEKAYEAAYALEAVRSRSAFNKGEES